MRDASHPSSRGRAANVTGSWALGHLAWGGHGLNLVICSLATAAAQVPKLSRFRRDFSQSWD